MDLTHPAASADLHQRVLLLRVRMDCRGGTEQEEDLRAERKQGTDMGGCLMVFGSFWSVLVV